MSWCPATRCVPGKDPCSPSAWAGFACLSRISWQYAEVPTAAAVAWGVNAPSANRAGGVWGSIPGAGELNCCAEQLENAGEEAGGRHTTPATAAPLGVQVVPGGAWQVVLCC